jgi:hypothetical protein
LILKAPVLYCGHSIQAELLPGQRGNPEKEFAMLAEINLNSSEVQPTGDLKPPSREQILALQNAMFPIKCELPEPEHYFAPGMYGRKLTLPAGMLIVGKAHKHAHLIMCLKGRAAIISEFAREEIAAGYIGVSQPGIKRAALAYEESVFVTVHLNKNDSQDLIEIESEHIIPEGEYLTSEKVKEFLK